MIATIVRFFRKRELASPEVVQQRPERLGTQRHMRMQCPRQIQIEGILHCGSHDRYTPHMPSMDTSSTNDSSTRSDSTTAVPTTAFSLLFDI